jgi:CheY-like chemotaxis protein
VPNAVICDDDAVLRSVVADLAQEAGLEVVAETDQGADVLNLVRRFGIDVVVLDLSLGIMSGNQVLAALREEGLAPLIIVFSAYAADDPELRALGARWVVDKPDLDRLEGALKEAAAAAGDERRLRETAGTVGEAAQPDAVERRFASRRTEDIGPAWRSPSGIEPASELEERLATCVPGDAILAVTVADPVTVRERAGDVLAADCVLEVARVLRLTVRVQDIVLDEPTCHGFLVLLRGGDHRAADAAWNRYLMVTRDLPTLTRAHPAAALVHENDGPEGARARAIAAALTSDGDVLIHA